MQTCEETNTDASLRNTPLAVPLATERNSSKRECRGICSLPSVPGARFQCWDILPRHRDVEQCFCVAAISYAVFCLKKKNTIIGNFQSRGAVQCRRGRDIVARVPCLYWLIGYCVKHFTDR